LARGDAAIEECVSPIVLRKNGRVEVLHQIGDIFAAQQARAFESTKQILRAKIQAARQGPRFACIIRMEAACHSLRASRFLSAAGTARGKSYAPLRLIVLGKPLLP
jgi:hypothetical protein